jgi:ribosomal protein S8E
MEFVSVVSELEEVTSSSELWDSKKVFVFYFNSFYNKGNFAWGSEGVTRKAKIVDIVYHASNNELVRTKTLTRGSIV